MGRRSINTTKSGKYMNPTDQARKEARKKELKKNKRQRQMVRAAVLKMKDPQQILEELQKIDEMEYNVLQPSPLNEKVLKEKRKKLRETFDRVLKMYDKDEPEKWVDLKRQEMEYDKRRAHLISYYESVKHAQSVQVDDIPLPTLQVPDNLIYGNVPSQIPLPIDALHPLPAKPTSILKKDSAYREKPTGAEPPGVPPGPPPDFEQLLLEAISEVRKEKEKKSLRFSDMPDVPPGTVCSTLPPPTETPQVPSPDCAEDPAGEPMEEDLPASPPAAAPAPAPKPTSLQQRMLALSGQNIDDFMKEMEEVHRKRERDRAADLNARLSALKRTNPGGHRDSDSDSDGEMPPAPGVPQAPPAMPQPGLQGIPQPGIPLPGIPQPGVPQPPPGLPPGVTQPGAPPLLSQMPQIPQEFGIEPPGAEMRMPPPLMPPGLRPPPLRAPLGPPPLRLPPAGARLGGPGPPPGPPPGLPPVAMLRPPGPPPGAPPRLLRPLVPPPPPKSLPPQMTVLSAAPQLISKKDGVQGATISAKPQIRNLSADVTRFVPSALRVKREDKKAKPVKTTLQRMQDVPKQAPSKDDAYMQFMREMEGLL